MKLPSKTVPAPDGGTHPLRTSRNPILGVYLHHCGSVASVHQPKGKRKNTRYLICEECGTDQCAGKEYQQKILDNMQPNIEALQKICDVPGELPVKTHEENTPDAPSVIDEIKAIGLEVDGETGEPLKPIDTAETAVYSQTQAEPLTEKLAEENAPAVPLNTAKTVVQTETTTTVDQAKPDNAKRVGLFAIIGAGVGALLAI